MIFNTNIEKIMLLFLREPLKGFHLREIERVAKIGLPSVKKYVDFLLKDGLIKKEKYGVYFNYSANRDSRNFKLLNRFYLLTNLNFVVEEISEKVHPNVIILFGSASKGEDTEKSDIDIFVQSKRKSFDFSKIESKLNRKINLLFEPNILNINKNLFNSIINGIVLQGVLEAK
ncbi:MAG: nucleotidyltransferase domain-containing protein [bacterium]